MNTVPTLYTQFTALGKSGEIRVRIRDIEVGIYSPQDWLFEMFTKIQKSEDRYSD